MFPISLIVGFFVLVVAPLLAFLAFSLFSPRKRDRGGIWLLAILAPAWKTCVALAGCGAALFAWESFTPSDPTVKAYELLFACWFILGAAVTLADRRNMEPAGYDGIFD